MLRNGIARSLSYISRTVQKLSREPLTMPQAQVRSVPGEERMQIVFAYPVCDGKERLFNFDRLQNEELEKTISRITTKVSDLVNKKLLKKQKKKKIEGANENETLTEVNVNLSHNHQLVPLSLSNVEAWVEGGVLVVCDKEYEIQVNLPSVKSLKLPGSLMAGFPIYPKLEVEFTSVEFCQCLWFSSTDEEEAGSKKSKREPWNLVHRGFSYAPSNGDIGRKLRLLCTPSDRRREGSDAEVISECHVTAGPRSSLFDNRHKYTQTPAKGNSFRIVSYNILADLYADSDFSRDYLYPYCPEYALHVDYRKQLIIKELQGYNADIICLQEVDRKVFRSDITSWCEGEGMQGHLKLKGGEVAEGTAVLYNKSRFSLHSEHGIYLKDAMQSEPKNADIREKVSSNAAFMEKMAARNSVLQVVVLERKDVPGEVLVVANTHLYFHPRAPHIRTVQTVLCVRHIEKVKRLLSDKDLNPTVIFCGDLNSALSLSGVHTFLRAGSVSAKHADWYSCGKEEFVEGMAFSHSLQLYSTCGYDNVTNYVSGFQGCLDYIYTEKGRLDTTMVVPLPTLEEIMEHTALPCVSSPSDHLAIVCDLTWTAPHDSAMSVQ